MTTIQNSIYAPEIQWTTNVSTPQTMTSFVGYNMGASIGLYVFTLPVTMNANDMFAVSSPFGTFSITAPGGRNIYVNGSNYTTVAMGNIGCSILLMCTTFLSTGNNTIVILNSSGTLTLTP